MRDVLRGNDLLELPELAPAAPAPHPGYDAAKRAIDVLGSGALLVLLGPAFALIALWIKRDSRGPVLFRQTRVGRGGRPFTCYKFRSMIADADQAVHREYVRGLLVGGERAESPELFKVPNDQRVTKAGARLRKTSLDELPQLWNVFTGSMSLVGPRPPIAYEVEMYEPWVRERLTVLPGMTGLWQVSGRSKLSVDDMFQLDIDYVRRRSLLLDLQILFRTIPTVLSSSRAA